MRIIAGSARRLLLKTVPGQDTRPTTDRIKETLFNILRDEVPGSRFLDLFAGSGQIGLEALSRGARMAVFVDDSKKAVSCIRENIASTRFEDKSEVYAMDAAAAIRRMEGRYSFDLVFMDPPYGKGLEREALLALASSSLLAEDAMLIVEVARGTPMDFVGECGFSLSRLKEYKTNAHAFLARVAPGGA